MRQFLLVVVTAAIMCSSAVGEEWFCSSLGSDALGDAANRWEQRDRGIGFVDSDQFLLLLAACPREFYAFMKARPKTLSTWLNDLEDLSGFTGSPKQKQEREAMLSRLVAEVSGSPAAASESEGQKQILDKLNTMCVRVVDQPPPTPPCRRVQPQT